MNLLRSSVDTLEHSFSGDVPEDVADKLDELKTLGQTREQPQSFLIAERELFVQPQSVRRYRWLLKNRDFVLMLKKAGSGPCLVAKLSAFGLATRGVHALWDELLEITSELHLSPLNLCRLDLAIDYQGWAPGFDEMRNVRCRSTYRPVVPNVDNPETYYFGKTSVMLRVYNKSKEIVDKDKPWWRPVWRETGKFEEGVDVWRIELELHGDVLKELGCRTFAVAMERRADLFSWGLEKTSLGLPNGDSNRARWPEDPRWHELRLGFGEPHPVQRVRRMPELLDYQRAVQRHVSIVSSLGASLGRTDYTEVSRLLFDGGEGYIAEKGKTFADLVEDKRLKRSL